MEGRDQNLLVDVERNAGAVRIRARGDLDLATTDDLRRASLTAVEQNGTESLTIDLSEIEFVDSAGLSVLLELRQTISARGIRFSVVTPDGPVRRAFEITGLGSLLENGDPGP